MQLSPGMKPINKTELLHCINAALSEKMMGFQRRVTRGGETQWRGMKGNGQWSKWDANLIDYSGRDEFAMNAAQIACERADNLSFNVSYDKRNKFITSFGVIKPPAMEPEWGFYAQGTILANALSASLCAVLRIDLLAMHRELFPGQHILTGDHNGYEKDKDAEQLDSSTVEGVAETGAECGTEEEGGQACQLRGSDSSAERDQLDAASDASHPTESR